MTDPLARLGALNERLQARAARAGGDWYRFSAHDVRTDEATVEIYDEIGLWGKNASDFAQDLAALPKSTNVINLRINSPGGSVFDGITIANRLRDHKATVRVTVDGVAASIASVIAMAGDSVHMATGSQMMIHNPSGVVIGSAADMREFADLLDQLAVDSIASAYRTKAGGSDQEWLDRMAAESWYGPAEALALGLADTADSPKSPDSTDGPDDRVRVHDLTAYGFRFPGRAAAPNPDLSNRSRAAVARIRNLRRESS